MEFLLDDELYLYDAEEVEHKIRIVEFHGFKEGKRSVVKINCSFVGGPNKGSRLRAELVIDKNGDLVPASDQKWIVVSDKLSPIRREAIVEMTNWEAKLRCKILGRTSPHFNHDHNESNPYEGYYYYETLAVLKKSDTHVPIGFKFAASVDAITKVIKPGTGKRLALMPYDKYEDLQDKPKTKKKNAKTA